MSTFLDAAYQVLEEAGTPLSAADITALAVRRSLIVASGKTPQQTMKSKLSTDILRHRERSRFMRSEAGKFALRRWSDEAIPEYVAKRHAKSLLNEQVMAFPRTSLPQYIPGPGLWHVNPKLGAELIDECRPVKRDEAEANPALIQLVSGFLVRCGSKILTYRRTRRLPEVRLHGVYSVLFGGHLNPDDFSMFNVFDPSNSALMERELNEELRLHSAYRLNLRGALYDDKRAVSLQHLAIVFDVDLCEPKYTVGERGFLQHDRFETWPEIGSRLDEFENWSQLLYRLHTSMSRE